MAVGGTSGSISQIAIRSMLGYKVNEPAVTPAPNPTTSTERGSVWNSAGTCREHPLQPHIVWFGGCLHFAADVELKSAVVPLRNGDGRIHALADVQDFRAARWR